MTARVAVVYGHAGHVYIGVADGETPGAAATEAALAAQLPADACRIASWRGAFQQTPTGIARLILPFDLVRFSDNAVSITCQLCGDDCVGATKARALGALAEHPCSNRTRSAEPGSPSGTPGPDAPH